MKVPAGFALTLLFLLSCHRDGGNAADAGMRSGSAFTAYATRFDVTECGTFRLLRVFDPWQNSHGIAFTYVLGSSRETVPDSLSACPFIRVPVKRVVTMSTTHVAMINALGAGTSIMGASGSRFIYDPVLRSRLDAGLIREVGYEPGLDYEAIVDLDPDVVFIYGVESSVSAAAGKLGEMGVPVVYCAEYLEDHPLGKAEWIRFFGLFYGLEDRALDFFRSVDSSYRNIALIASKAENRPRVLTGLPWKDTWYVAGGQSFAARLIRDAGGTYLWEDDPSTEAIPLDLESVYSKAVEADIWINPGLARSLDELVRFDERFAGLPTVVNGSVYNNTARFSPGGGNDYWESGTIRPDLILADLLVIFHPGILPDPSLFYYRKLK
jgi:iron complex transport system substrate-binding protein